MLLVLSVLSPLLVSLLLIILSSSQPPPSSSCLLAEDGLMRIGDHTNPEARDDTVVISGSRSTHRQEFMAGWWLRWFW
jgi:hypothetical protein